MRGGCQQAVAKLRLSRPTFDPAWLKISLRLKVGIALLTLVTAQSAPKLLAGIDPWMHGTAQATSGYDVQGWSAAEWAGPGANSPITSPSAEELALLTEYTAAGPGWNTASEDVEAQDAWDQSGPTYGRPGHHCWWDCQNPWFENLPRPVDLQLDDVCQLSDKLEEPWQFQLLPKGLIYRSYLAGSKESRFRSVWNKEDKLGWIWDITLGGRVGLMRWGTRGGYFPQGFQWDIEGASILRLDPEENRDLVAADFRFGIPLTYGWRRWQTKLAFYHLSSHLGDEYMLSHPLNARLNYTDDSFVLGQSWYPTEDFRVYGEVSYGFLVEVKKPWAFQFGFEYSPYFSRGIRGSPFVAMNGTLRQEVDYGGEFTCQAGWQWRGQPGSGIFRLGLQYHNGMSELYEFHNRFEQKIGAGLWYDF